DGTREQWDVEDDLTGAPFEAGLADELHERLHEREPGEQSVEWTDAREPRVLEHRHARRRERGACHGVQAAIERVLALASLLRPRRRGPAAEEQREEDEQCEQTRHDGSLRLEVLEDLEVHRVTRRLHAVGEARPDTRGDESTPDASIVVRPFALEGEE